MYIDIVTPEKKLFSGEVKLVKLPGLKGSFEMLNRHAPIISPLEKGEIKVIDMENAELFFDIDGGVVEMSNSKAIVLAE